MVGCHPTKIDHNRGKIFSFHTYYNELHYPNVKITSVEHGKFGSVDGSKFVVNIVWKNTCIHRW